ncbi:helix-turn-helix transcriptional regulator [Streptomyces kaniharaensis]|uniref:Helix-turn-helix transcriptional regulator n=1 Tax=Streptomyces kaniharaensis TaxID=212423 RepID=A0A6N7KUV4_9ACTN|nr:TetR/AcrR family transcriptional regulator [Streptomyces kaniharaensis]MQS14369.1 helix-turn-helix transcriptional regulator [Streptomyces kaniharaensis]
MTDSQRSSRAATAAAKRRRLTAAAAQVLHHKGVERTAIADIAQAAGVPVGNVYYYFKTKDELVEAALTEHTATLDTLTAELDRLPDPRARLRGLVTAWVTQRETAARYGCPIGTLAVEVDKRDPGGLDESVARAVRRLLDWAAQQFRELGTDDPDGHALTLVAGYQGMSLLANALRDPEVMTREGERLLAWIDAC